MFRTALPMNTVKWSVDTRIGKLLYWTRSKSFGRKGLTGEVSATFLLVDAASWIQMNTSTPQRAPTIFIIAALNERNTFGFLLPTSFSPSYHKYATGAAAVEPGFIHRMRRELHLQLDPYNKGYKLFETKICGRCSVKWQLMTKLLLLTPPLLLLLLLPTNFGPHTKCGLFFLILLRNPLVLLLILQWVAIATFQCHDDRVCAWRAALRVRKNGRNSRNFLVVFSSGGWGTC